MPPLLSAQPGKYIDIDMDRSHLIHTPVQYLISHFVCIHTCRFNLLDTVQSGQVVENGEQPV